jgi:hypothetical protein
MKLVSGREFEAKAEMIRERERLTRLLKVLAFQAQVVEPCLKQQQGWFCEVVG